MLWSTAPPEPRTRLENWPTLLYSWWTTCFAFVIIITRLSGRKVRSNVLFREDWIMMAALVPLFVRMGFVHVVLYYGTNNVMTEGHSYTEEELHQRAIGSRLVLAARIWYAIFIWMSKWTVSEFLKRITIHLWRPSYEYTLHCIRIFLLFTLVAVIIATLAECQPFEHYWQVIPDPGAQCRQGFAQLLTMGTADIITDILLVAFPIPIVLRSGQTWRRKLQLAALFSTSIALIIITGLRMPQVINRHGRQQYRTVWASSEMLASAFVSNFVIIGSFLRDKGTKRNKYRTNGSVSDSIDRASVRRVPTLQQQQSWGSDEDLFRALGCRIPEHLQPSPPSSEHRMVRLAPQAPPVNSSQPISDQTQQERESTEPIERPSTDSALPSHSTKPAHSLSFFDVGGLLEDGPPSSPTSSHSPAVSRSTGFPPGASFTVATDFATAASSSISTQQRSRRGSHAFLADIGGILPSPSTSTTSHSLSRELPTSCRRPPGGRSGNAPIGVLGPMLERQETMVSLQDAGGLLADESPRASGALGDGEQAGKKHGKGAMRPGLARTPTDMTLNDVGGLLQ